jgi:predicted nucleic acid-binding protein
VNYLVDTNVLSETVKPQPDCSVLRWFEAVADESLFLSALTLGEIQQGIDRLGQGRRQALLTDWLARRLPEWFEDRLLPITPGIARRWGSLNTATRNSIPVIDGLLAATAFVHDLCVVTRNTRDFGRIPGLMLLNPWQDLRS